EGKGIELADRLASLDISIATSVPIGRGVMPIPLLQKQGVNDLQWRNPYANKSIGISLFLYYQLD
ncbi:hypothetical protein, partial [Pseudoneobacillus rhizosphaerae]|uniref:hypothetical protein n=1 Tax=Pseudoneobacillus rhizosphaerae TaxID=2880968 RepID=UPI001E300495